ncbi:acyl-CoA dehydrogenase family protein [Nocardia sp. NEAU-351]|uniref:Acyl-CoA dehydrogenase family protein n=1 Tax=Nocardia bovistercoris TaxID=2785916 RepID=A0A931I9G8_9NOCA|nr:acyl-CoA dehydrogenase family protein [Nocardia bovistercoris]MBH0776325.1 acyl-CoA dehydrogenase family protein [Nocardia bovistercoris]
MDFSLPPQVREFRDELRTWLARNLTEDIVSAGRRASSDPTAFEIVRTWSRTMAADAWAAVSWPVEYGGRDATLLMNSVASPEPWSTRALFSPNWGGRWIAGRGCRRPSRRRASSCDSGAPRKRRKSFRELPTAPSWPPSACAELTIPMSSPPGTARRSR